MCNTKFIRSKAASRDSHMRLRLVIVMTPFQRFKMKILSTIVFTRASSSRIATKSWTLKWTFARRTEKPTDAFIAKTSVPLHRRKKSGYVTTWPVKTFRNFVIAYTIWRRKFIWFYNQSSDAMPNVFASLCWAKGNSINSITISFAIELKTKTEPLHNVSRCSYCYYTHPGTFLLLLASFSEFFYFPKQPFVLFTSLLLLVFQLTFFHCFEFVNSAYDDSFLPADCVRRFLLKLRNSLNFVLGSCFLLEN